MIPTVAKFGWELYGAIVCLLSDSGVASLGLFALFSDFGSVLTIGSITGGYELAELIFVQLFLISVVVLDAVISLFIIKSKHGDGELCVSKHFVECGAIRVSPGRLQLQFRVRRRFRFRLRTWLAVGLVQHPRRFYRLCWLSPAHPQRWSIGFFRLLSENFRELVERCSVLVQNRS